MVISSLGYCCCCVPPDQCELKLDGEITVQSKIFFRPVRALPTFVGLTDSSIAWKDSCMDGSQSLFPIEKLVLSSMILKVVTALSLIYKAIVYILRVPWIILKSCIWVTLHYPLRHDTSPLKLKSAILLPSRSSIQKVKHFPFVTQVKKSMERRNHLVDLAAEERQ